MIGPAPMCMWCVHFRDDIGPVDEEGGHTGPLACMAFLNGIPDVIIDNDFDHRQPYPGDNDVNALAANANRVMKGEMPVLSYPTLQ